MSHLAEVFPVKQALGLAALAGIVSLFQHRLSRVTKAKRKGKGLRITQLWYFPIKSCGGIQVETVQLDKCGVKWDRKWMIVNSNNVFITQRAFPKMALIQPSLEFDAGEAKTLILNAPDMSEIRLPIGSTSSLERVTVNVWGNTFTAGEFGGEAARQWLTTFFGKECKLLTTLDGDEHKRFLDAAYDPSNGTIQTNFTDEFPVHFGCIPSADVLSARMVANGAQPASIHCFRPNVIIDGDVPPFAEDFWRRVQIGNSEYHVVKPCDRCTVPLVNQSVGERFPEGEPQRTLKEFRKAGPQGKVFFGQFLVHCNPNAILHVGDEVNVLELQDLELDELVTTNEKNAETRRATGMKRRQDQSQS